MVHLIEREQDLPPVTVIQQCEGFEARGGVVGGLKLQHGGREGVDFTRGR